MKNTRIALVIITLFFVCVLKTYAGQEDTLGLKIEQEVDEIKKVELQVKYANQLANLSMDSAINFIDSNIVIYQEKGFDLGVGRMISIKSWFFVRLAQYEKSLKFGHTALRIQEEIDDSLGIALTLLRIGLNNGQFNRLSEAKDYTLKALDYFILLKDSARIDAAYNNLGVFETENKNFDQGIYYYKESLKIRSARENYYWMAYSYYNISNLLSEKEELDSARKYISISIETFKKTKNKRIPGMVSLGMAELLKQKGNYNMALEYVRSSFEDSEKLNHVEIILEGKKIMAELLFKVKKYEEAYMAQSEYYELKNELDSANSASNVAEIEEEYKFVKQQLELSKLELENSEELSRSQYYNMIVSYFLLALLVVSLLLGFIYFKQQQQQKNEKARIEEKLSDLKLLALRSQMNPHFIFNCINTAQNFVLAKETKTGYEYLSKFAQLLRLILENSNHSCVYLEDEIKQMKLYLELEATRFNNQFSYDINIDSSLKSGTFEIPGMLIQPFIENAIIHGLANRKDRTGNIFIRLDLVEDTIRCEIKDNGVGRVRANEIKTMKEKHFQSMAISNIKERLTLLQENSDTSLNIEIIDLYEKGMATGTQVILYLPVT